MKELVEFLVKSLVDKKESVVVEVDGADIRVSVDKDDMGKVIGKQGRIAKAISTVVRAASSKQSIKYNLIIED